MASATVFSIGELCNLKIRTKRLFNALGKSIEINAFFFILLYFHIHIPLISLLTYYVHILFYNIEYKLSHTSELSP